MSKEFDVMECLDKLEECAEAMKDLPKSNWTDLAENEAELDLKIMDWVETIKFELLKGKQALLELKQIKETKPSEALEIVDKMTNYILLDKEYGFIDAKEEQSIIKDRATIEQALLKAQEQEKEDAKSLQALEIIVDKNVDTAKLRLCFMFFDIEKDEEEMNMERCSYYNNGQCVDDKLSLAEFKTLKEVLYDRGNDEIIRKNR